jgi:hypothetical protein
MVAKLKLTHQKCNCHEFTFPFGVILVKTESTVTDMVKSKFQQLIFTIRPIQFYLKGEDYEIPTTTWQKANRRLGPTRALAAILKDSKLRVCKLG